MAAQLVSDVLVVGAGPVGLLMATELARHGITCRVVDAAPGPSEHCKALAVQSRTMEIFEHVGILDRALRVGLIMRAANIYQNGMRIQRFEIDPTPMRDVPYPFVLSLEQSQTERILGEHLRSLGRQVEWKAKLLDLKQDKQGVTATLCYPSGREEQARTQYLVGCDGAHSTVRHMLALPFEGSTYPLTFILADVEISWSLSAHESHRFSSGLFAWPIRGKSRFYLSVQEDEAASRPIPEEGAVEHGLIVDKHGAPPTLAEMQALVDAHGPSGTILSNPRWLARYRISRRIVPCYWKNRVFLAGDAAHIHATTGGQGMNTGLQDAYNLAWKLALVLSGAGQPELLGSYHAERYPIGLMVLDTADRTLAERYPIKRIGPDTADYPLQDWTEAGSVSADPDQARRRMLRQFAQLHLNYRHSPIVAGYPLQSDKGYPGVQPGDRAPDGTLTLQPAGKARRLFDLLCGTRHHLLLFFGITLSAVGNEILRTTAARVLDRYSAQIAVYWIVPEGYNAGSGLAGGPILTDDEGILHSTYGAANASLCLIRPDRYIGFCGEAQYANELIPYLEKILV